MEYLTEKLAQLVNDTGYEDIPDTAIQSARDAIIDCIAAISGGVPTENARLSRAAARATFGEGLFKPWLTNEPGMHELGALFSNCAAASALDIDDGHRAAAGHPGAAIIPAALMRAIALNLDGYDLLAGIVLGYEVALRIASARRHVDDISFASGIWTGYGVAAALGFLEKHDAGQIAHAISIAGAEAPANLPQGACTASSVKGSSPWSTVAAWVASARSRVGATGSLDMLDRDAVYDTASMLKGLGERWSISDIYFKPYAACRYTHPVIDAIVDMKRQHRFVGSDIRELTVQIFPEARKLPNSVRPTSLEDAQFSIPFTTALAAFYGESGFRPMTVAHLGDSDVLALSESVRIEYPDSLLDHFPKYTPAHVQIVLGDAHIDKTVTIPIGEPGNPLSRQQLTNKLQDLAPRGSKNCFARSIAEHVQGLGNAGETNVQEFNCLLQLA